MKALGIVRKIDELGRIVIPKEVRRINGWEAGTPIEMFATTEGVNMQEYKRDTEKQEMLNQLYDVLQHTENEDSYKIIGQAIDFLKRQ